MSILLTPPFTRQQINEMHARDYDFVCKKWPEAVRLALSPPPAPVPAPPLFPRSDITKIAVAEEMASEYLAFAKSHILGDGTIPEFVWDEFLKSKNEAAQLKDAEAEVEKWLASHPEFIISESNRKTVWDYLSENDFKVSGENLEKAFTAVRSSLALDETKLSYDLNEPDTRVGSYTNGVFRPYDPGHSQNTIKAPLGLGQHVPGSSDDMVIRKDSRKMSSTEYAEALRISSSFREKMNKS
jgi:hypothetical protein